MTGTMRKRRLQTDPAADWRERLAKQPRREHATPRNASSPVRELSQHLAALRPLSGSISLQAARTRVMRQRLGDPFSMLEIGPTASSVAAAPLTSTDFDGKLRQFSAALPGCSGTVAVGTLLTKRQTASVSTRWTDTEKTVVLNGIEAGLTLGDIANLLPKRGYHACKALYHRMTRLGQNDDDGESDDPDTGVVAGASEKGEGIPPHQDEHDRELGFAADDGLVAETPGEAPAEHERSQALGALTDKIAAGPARMFTELVLKCRSTAEEHAHTLFQYLPRQADFANATSTLADWHAACMFRLNVSAAYSARLIKLCIPFCICLGDFNCQSAAPFGKLRCDVDGRMYYSNEAWDIPPSDWLMQTPFQRANLVSVELEWLWSVRNSNPEVMTILTGCATPEMTKGRRRAQNQDAHVVEISVATSVVDGVERGIGKGPLILIILPQAIIFTCVRHMLDCAGALVDGISCSRQSNRTVTGFELSFDIASPAFQAWSTARAVEMQGNSTERIMSRMRDTWEAAQRGEDDVGIHLEPWSDVRARVISSGRPKRQ